ncbi:hypothetical protein AB4Z50_14525 [Paenibacillus sp. 2TAB26]|uniref:hypothetical protein n=1 Tax=Paenibacillus sp. 2TAB26 TaxID=3233005 RepID=UPI003F9976C2
MSRLGVSMNAIIKLLVAYEFDELTLAKEFVIKRQKESLIFIAGDDHKTWLVTKGNSLKLKDLGYKEIT